MTDYIRIKCPTCLSEYDVSLSVISAGKPKAKCGKCHTSFMVKENMVNTSFLEEPDEVISPSDSIYAHQDYTNSNFLDNIYKPRQKNSDFSDAQNSDFENIQQSQDLAKLTIVDDNDNVINITPERIHTPTHIRVRNKQNRHKKNNIFGKTIVALLLILLVGQLVVFNFDTLIKHPSSNHKLQLFCQVLSCNLPNIDASQIAIANQYYKPNQINNNETDIVATIVNENNQPQLIPNLKVQIYDSNGIIADFIAEPNDYLLTPQNNISKSQVIPFMLTIPINVKNIEHIEITPFY